MDIDNSVALVTGGASGLGLATVKRLHAAGAGVVIVDLPSSQGETVAKELGVLFVAADVTDADGVEKALDAAATLGPLRITVNCAGIGNAAGPWASPGRSRWRPSRRSSPST